MRESENYRDTLDDVRARVDRMFPGKVVFSAPDIAKMFGKCVKTVYNWGLTSNMTAAEIARTLCRREA